MHRYRALSLFCLFIFSHAFAADGFCIFKQAVRGMQKQSVDVLLDELLQTAQIAEFTTNPVVQAIVADDSAKVSRVIQSGQPVTEQHLHLAVLTSVAHENDGGVVRVLIDQKAPVDFKSKKLGTPLMLAASSNRVDLVEMLCNAGAISNAIDKDGDTALHYAARSDAADAARYLLERGGAFPAPCNRFDLTPVHLAASRDATNVLTILADRADCSMRHPILKRTPLSFALWKKSETAALVLISKRAGIETLGRKDKTPLHEAAGKGLLNALQALLPLVACDVQDTHQRTPLVYALLKGQVPAADILIDAGVSLDIPNHKGNTALHIAAAKGMINIVDKLLARGAGTLVQNSFGKYPKEMTTDPEIHELFAINEAPRDVRISSSSLRLPGESSQSDSDHSSDVSSDFLESSESDENSEEDGESSEEESE